MIASNLSLAVVKKQGRLTLTIIDRITASKARVANLIEQACSLSLALRPGCRKQNSDPTTSRHSWATMRILNMNENRERKTDHNSVGVIVMVKTHNRNYHRLPPLTIAMQDLLLVEHIQH